MTSTFSGIDAKQRCSWCNASEDYIAYHDQEWGFPTDDDFRLFEKICLEGFQSGLSWRTILTKRDNFRSAFKDFDFYKVSEFSEKDVEHLLLNSGIVRHRGKIEATINNAICATKMVESEGSLAAFFWRFEPQTSSHQPQSVSKSPESIALSKELKKRGWKFVGPTTMYAFMQAMGLINDHMEGCFYRSKVAKARRSFKKPI